MFILRYCILFIMGQIKELFYSDAHEPRRRSHCGTIYDESCFSLRKRTQQNTLYESFLLLHCSSRSRIPNGTTPRGVLPPARPGRAHDLVTSRHDRSFEFRNGYQEKGTRSLPTTGTQEGRPKFFDIRSSDHVS